MSKTDSKQRQYMALAPFVSLAGIFIHPVASTIAPLILFFIFRNSRPNVGTISLRTADMAFSIQLWIMLISLALMLGISMNMITANDAREMMNMATITILVIFVVSLAIAIYQAFNGKVYKYLFSFRIAERVFSLVSKRNENNKSNS